MLVRAVLFTSLLGCSFERLAPVDRIDGTVRGLWDGSDGVVVRLQADGIDERVTVATDGSFELPSILEEGTPYAVTLESPAGHACDFEAGASGLAGGHPDVAIACRGPATITLSLPTVAFDPASDIQSHPVSVLAQQVSIIVDSTASNVTATVDGASVTLGRPSSPIALSRDAPTTIAIAITAGSLSNTYQLALDRDAVPVSQLAYGKASDAAAGRRFASAIAIAGDTMVIGARGGLTDPGAVYIFARTGASWTQVQRLVAPNAGNDDGFGASVAISGDTLVVGAPFEDSSSAALASDNEAATDAGAVYTFQLVEGTWMLRDYLKATPPRVDGVFGGNVAIEGDRLVVGEQQRSTENGRVYELVRPAGGSFQHRRVISAPNPDTDDRFGFAVALSGTTLAVGAFNESGSATGVTKADDLGTVNNNDAPSAGAVYLFDLVVGEWVLNSFVKPLNTQTNDLFGHTVALSGDTLVVGALREDGGGIGVDPAIDELALDSGAVYVFERTADDWTQTAYIKPPTPPNPDQGFGIALAISSNLIAIGATQENGCAVGVNAQGTGICTNAGAAYLLRRDGATWIQHSYLKASNTGVADELGAGLALSGDTLAVGAAFEDASATGNQSDNSVNDAGAVYVFQ